jgi:preprotein translocase subunit SecY
MIGSLADVGKIPELRKRILFTIGLLAVYRFGVFVSTPGIDVEALRRMFDTGDGTLFGLINLFSGGALEHFSIFTLGITPYISVSIIMQVLTPTIPALEALKKEGEAGRRIITRYTRWGTIGLALFQAYAIAHGLQGQGLVRAGVSPLVFALSTMVTLTAGTAFIMWLGEQITEKGIGNGTSMVIFTGIVARMPEVLFATIAKARTNEIHPGAVLLLLSIAIFVVAAIVFVERSYRKIPIQYPRRTVGKNVAQAQTQYLPLKVNMAGVIPPIFASALIVVPLTIAQFSGVEALQSLTAYLRHGTFTYTSVFLGLIVLFCFFYTAIIFNPEEVAENLKKNGGFIPTVRPGKPTADYLYAVLNRLTLWGAVYISFICLFPEYMFFYLGAPEFARVFGGTAILIVVGVTLDTASQIESHILARNYESFMSRSSKSRGGLGSMGYSRTRLLKR